MDHYKTIGRRKVVGHTASFWCPCCNRYLKKGMKKKLRRTTRRLIKQEQINED